MCEENVLNDIYAFLTQLLKVEFEHICQSLIGSSLLKDKKKKIRRKVVMIMTTLEPILENIPTTVNDCVVSSSSTNSSSSSNSSKIEFIIEDDKEIDTTVQIKVKRSYNKKVKPAL